MLLVLVTLPIILAILSSAETAEPMNDPQDVELKVLDIEDLKKERRARGGDYLSFLDVPALSLGLYELEKGARDRQSPHTRDEAYYVLEGRAVFVAEDKRHPVHPGSVIYVRRGADHRFEEISEDLSVLVFFAAEPKPR
jgi:mannose-6-phosphate isomerase-like protein (cupin superfamily)